ncbi:MAG TPA: hypothetical protein VGX76_00350 [Pirellulales bacterium]|jgi:hypothetical protein|nr:hypothetical protein [Pirellulales bacterium]
MFGAELLARLEAAVAKVEKLDPEALLARFAKVEGAAARLEPLLALIEAIPVIGADVKLVSGFVTEADAILHALADKAGVAPAAPSPVKP